MKTKKAFVTVKDFKSLIESWCELHKVMLTIHGKGRKVRTLPLTDKVRKLIKEWIFKTVKKIYQEAVP